MKTVQFQRNKQQLRDQLLSGLLVSKQKRNISNKSRSKSKQNTVQIQQNIKLNQLHKKNKENQGQQLSHGPRIKLKLKKKIDTQDKTSVREEQQCLFTMSKINQNIKKAIEKQLLSSFYKDQSKIVDNRKTAIREDDNDSGQIQDSSMNQFSSKKQNQAENHQIVNVQVTKSPSRMVNSFAKQNFTKSPLNPGVSKSPSLQKSKKFIPEDQVHIPKSFVTYTVRRKNYHEEINQYKQQDQRIDKQLNQNNTKEVRNIENSLEKIKNLRRNSMVNEEYKYSEELERKENELEREQKIAFYNRQNENYQSRKSFSKKREIKQSSIKKASQVKICQEEHKSKTIKFGQQPQKNKDAIENKEMIKLTKSRYQEANQASLPFQTPPLSLTSSLNYSTPFPSNKSPFVSNQINNQSVTINKLSSISKRPQAERYLSPSPDKQTLKPLQFSQLRQQTNKSDILINSINKFKEYDQKRQQISRQKIFVKGGQKQKINEESERQNQNKLQTQFNDFEEIFLNSNNLDIKKEALQSKQMKRQNQTKETRTERENMQNKRSFAKSTDKKDRKDRELQIIQDVKKMEALKMEILPNEEKIIEQKKQIRDEDKNMIESHRQQQQKADKGIQHQRFQQDKSVKIEEESFVQSQIQKSLSDFTPQPSLAEISIIQQARQNSQPMESERLTLKEQQLIKPRITNQKVMKAQTNKQQVMEVESNNKQVHERSSSQISLHQLSDYRFQQEEKEEKQQNDETNMASQALAIYKFDDFPDWKYGDRRDYVLQQKRKEIQSAKVNIIQIEIKQSHPNIIPVQMKKQTQKTIPNFTSKTNTQNQDFLPHMQSKVTTPQYHPTSSPFQSLSQPQSKQNKLNSISDQPTTQIPMKPKTSKVRVLENVEISSSSTSQPQGENQKKNTNSINEAQQNKTTVEKNNISSQQNESIENRYYSSSDEQDQPIPSQKSIQEEHLKSKKSTFKKPKESSIPSQSKKTFNTKVKLLQPEQDKTNSLLINQNSIPLGVNTSRKKDLFSVLEDSQQWNHGSQSVAEGESVKDGKNNFEMKIVEIGKDKNLLRLQNQNNTKQIQQINKSINQTQQPDDNQMKLLQQQFGQKPVSMIQIQSDDEKMIKDISGFSQSQQKNISHITHSLSDFTKQQEEQRKDNSTVDAKKIAMNQKLVNKVQQSINEKAQLTSKNNQTVNTYTQRQIKPVLDSSQINKIKEQRNYINSLKDHVTTLLKRISSEHKIESDTELIKENSIEQYAEKYTSSFEKVKSITNSQPSIRPIKMSSQSETSEKSFVEKYEEENVRQSVVKAKDQKLIKDNQSKYPNKYQINQSKQADVQIQSHPLFDFSDKNSSDQERKRKVSSVKNYSKSDQHESISQNSGFSLHSAHEQIEQQKVNKEQILKQFDEIARQSAKNFSKNKHHYLTIKNKQNSKKFALPEQSPILRPIEEKRLYKTQNYVQQIDVQDKVDNKRDKSPEMIHAKKWKRNRTNSSQGSSGETVYHKELQIVPQSLYITNARNTSSGHQHLPPKSPLSHQSGIKKGLSISKKISSSFNHQSHEPSQTIEKKSSHGSDTSGFMNNSSSGHRKSSSVMEQKGRENQSLWNFIMKK